jgi:hypothetical protein
MLIETVDAASKFTSPASDFSVCPGNEVDGYGDCPRWKTPGDGIIDPIKCGEAAPELGDGETAIVFTHNLYGGKLAMDHFARVTAWAKPKGIDTVLILPPDTPDTSAWSIAAKKKHWRLGQVRALQAEEAAQLALIGVKVKRVPWALPPGLDGNALGCASMDLIRLQVWNMTEYRAVVYIDSEVHLINHIELALRCAATGKLLMTAGPLAPLNAGVMFVKPESGLFEAAVWFASQAKFHESKEGGWDNATSFPKPGGFVGFGCGQGFIWSLLYGNGKSVGHSAEMYTSKSPLAVQARRKFPHSTVPFMMNRCYWNYQAESVLEGCGDDFDCTKLNVLHKPHERVSNRYLDVAGICGLCEFGKGCKNLLDIPRSRGDGYEFCATEGEQCKCKGMVKFGVWHFGNNSFFVKVPPFDAHKTGSVRCHTNDIITDVEKPRDPHPGQVKHCFCNVNAAAPAVAPSLLSNENSGSDIGRPAGTGPPTIASVVQQMHELGKTGFKLDSVVEELHKKGLLSDAIFRKLHHKALAQSQGGGGGGADTLLVNNEARASTSPEEDARLEQARLGGWVPQ